MRPLALVVALALVLALSGPAIGQQIVVLLEEGGGQRTYHPLRFGEGGLEAGPTFVAEGLASPDRQPGPARRLDSVDGDILYVGSLEADKVAVERVPLFVPDAAVGRVELAGQTAPVSLLAFPGRCLVGGVGWVGQADFIGQPHRIHIIDRYEPETKPIDFFLKDEALRRVYAVDDIAMPYFVRVFRLGEDDMPTFEETLRLPAVINGHYAQGTSHEGRLYLYVPFSVLSGTGHGLAEIEARRLAEVPKDHPINSGTTRPGYVEETVGRAGPGKNLFAGEALTPWQGLGVIGEWFLAGAGARGVLVLHLPLGPETTGRAVDVGGACLDLIVSGQRAYALVEGEDARQLVVLVARDDTFVVDSRHDLKGKPGRFVR